MTRDSGIYSGEAMTEEWLIEKGGDTSKKVSLQEMMFYKTGKSIKLS